ncbi:MAG: hypothetical protein QOE73_1025 [Verrucomicrobiota bacterium]
MPFGRRLLRASLLAVLIAVILFWIAPTGVANGVRLWLWWQARQQGLKIEVGKIEAPLLRPVVIQHLHVSSAQDAPCRIEVDANQAIVSLQLARILTGASGRAIHALTLDAVRVETRCHAANEREKSRLAWATLQKLLPDNFNIAKLDLRIEKESTIFLLHNASLSGSQIDAGRFTVGELTIVSPLFRQTFSELHGAIDWRDNRLTFGGFSLRPGLAMQSVTTDLSHLAKRRVGMELDIDAFGGKLRANISSEWRNQPSDWNIAGSASEVSLAQTLGAFGFTDRIGGQLHAGKFTFRGSTHDLTHATASVWMELTDSSWAGRTSEVIMLGAALYNRQIDLQQFYVKQRNNQLTLSGEGVLPANSTAWLNPDFRGDISASIHDLGDFAGLFGAAPGDFAGEIAIEGTMNARDRKFGGHLTATGASLTLFKTSIDALHARFDLKAKELEIEQFELKRKSDSLVAHGRIDMSREHDYSGELNARVGNVAEYVSILRGPSAADSKPAPAEIHLKIEAGKWDLRGVLMPPGSSPVNLSASFLLPIGTDWKNFATAPINIALDFPTILLANAPQFFHPEIFHDGILSGKVTLTQTLQHPRITGDVQLLNGRLQNAPMNLIEANGRIAFEGERGAIEFLNASTKDVDLSFRGEVDLHDSSDLGINISAVLPIFDLTSRTMDCASKIEFVPIGLTLAPAIESLELHGSMNGDWSLTPKESGTTRTLRLCLGNGADGKVLAIGAHPRPEPVQPRKRTKRP